MRFSSPRLDSGLIAFEVEGLNRILIFRRAPRRVSSESVEFRPFLLLAGDEVLQGWRGRAEFEALAGGAPFDRIAFFPDLKQLEDAKFHLQKQARQEGAAADVPYYYFSDPVQQYLLLSGKTHFLGLAFGDLKRMQIDIETYCDSAFEFCNPLRESDRITAIAMSDSTGWERLWSPAGNTARPRCSPRWSARCGSGTRT
jgi:hypothetical protein